MLREPQAHYNIAFSCVTYLTTTVYLLAPSPLGDYVKTQVVKGFHGLHNYANEYWFQHLLQCAQDLGELDASGNMISALCILRARYWKSMPGDAALGLKLDDTTTEVKIMNELAAFGDIDLVRQMGTDMQTFRSHMIQERHAHEAANSMCISHTPSPETDP